MKPIRRKGPVVPLNIDGELLDMSETSIERQYEPLGIGQIIGETFAIMKGNILAVLLLGGIPSLVSLILTWLLLGAEFVTGDFSDDPADFQAGFGFTMFLLSVISFAIYGVALALFSQLAYDSKLGRPVQPARYVEPAMASVVYIVVLTLIISLLAMIGFVLFVVPGMWVYAVYSVVIPAVVIERAGFGALGRSISLTKEYRWPIVLLIVISGVIAVAISLVGSVLASLVPGGMIVDLILLAVLYSISYGIFGILMVLIYARLREIKEGVGVNDLVSVFE